MQRNAVNLRVGFGWSLWPMVLLIGCVPIGGGGGSGSGGAGPGGGGTGSSRGVTAVLSRLDDWVEASCDRVRRCQPYLPIHREDCQARYEVSLSLDLAAFRRFEAAGTLVVSAQNLDRCLQWAKTGACTAEQPEACSQIVRGVVRAGGACRADLECVDGWCDVFDAACGVCVAEEEGFDARAPVGESCDARNCERGLYCADVGDGVSRCVDPASHFTSTEGQACGPSYSGCRTDLVCTFDESADGSAVQSCLPYVGPGEACYGVEGTFIVGQGNCVAGLACVRPDLTQEGICEPLVPAGRDCGQPSMGGAGCEPSAFCIGGECRSPTPVGGRCANFDECSDGDCVDGVCTLPPLADCREASMGG